VGTIHTSLKTCNPRNIIHGGAMYAVMDQLAGLAACTTGLTCVTINGTIDYLRSAPPESDLLCEAVVVKAGKRVTLCEAKLFCGDKLIAKGSFAYCTMEPLAEALS
jgi:acyl-CoA thioesterase